jgi:hypothetical protein
MAFAGPKNTRGSMSVATGLHAPIEQRTAKLLEAGRRVVERSDDVLAVVGIKARRRLSLHRRAKKRLRRPFRMVALQPLCELDDEVVAQRKPGKPHLAKVACGVAS